VRKRNELRNKFIKKIRASRKQRFTSEDFKDVIKTGSKSVPRGRLISTTLYHMNESNLIKRVGRGEYIPNRKAINAVLPAA
jgi:hypothetical protein